MGRESGNERRVSYWAVERVRWPVLEHSNCAMRTPMMMKWDYAVDEPAGCAPYEFEQQADLFRDGLLIGNVWQVMNLLDPHLYADEPSDG